MWGPVLSLAKKKCYFSHPEKGEKAKNWSCSYKCPRPLACFSSNQTDILSFLHLFYSQTWTWHDRKKTHDIVCLVKWDWKLKQTRTFSPSLQQHHSTLNYKFWKKLSSSCEKLKKTAWHVSKTAVRKCSNKMVRQSLSSLYVNLTSIIWWPLQLPEIPCHLKLAN